jgi:hypothetical protein
MVDSNRLVKAHLAIRDKRRDLKHAYEEQDKILLEKQELLEATMMGILNSQGPDTNLMATAAGTFYREMDVTPQGSDWDAFYTWVAKNNAFEALERRITKTFVKKYMADNNGEVPPGVSVFKKYIIRVRRK